MLECSEPIQIVSVFEWGLQPLTAGTAAQYLEAHDYPVRVTDIFIDGFEAENYRRAWLVAIAVPVFDALAGAVSVAAKIKETNPLAHITFFGQYATVQHTQLVPVHGDSAICGDWEEPLRQLARALANGDTTSEIDGVYLGSGSPPKYWARDVIARPARHLLPQLLRYNTVDTDHGTELKSVIAGNVEVTRGCHFPTSHLNTLLVLITFWNTDQWLQSCEKWVVHGLPRRSSSLQMKFSKRCTKTARSQTLRRRRVSVKRLVKISTLPSFCLILG